MLLYYVQLSFCQKKILNNALNYVKQCQYLHKTKNIGDSDTFPSVNIFASCLLIIYFKTLILALKRNSVSNVGCITV